MMCWGRSVILGLALAVGGCGTSSGPTTTVIPTGTWGSLAAQMDVTSSGASVELCCASGSISGPLTVSSSGSFVLEGTLTPVGGAATTQPPLAATYSGSITGNTMNLLINAPPRPPQSATLTFGDHMVAICSCPF